MSVVWFHRVFKNRVLSKKRQYACYLKNIRILIRIEVLTAVSTKMAVFWVVAPCSLVEVYQRFGGPCCLLALQPRRLPSSQGFSRLSQYPSGYLRGSVLNRPRPSPSKCLPTYIHDYLPAPFRCCVMNSAIQAHSLNNPIICSKLAPTI
jgi:hypothetical protein